LKLARQGIDESGGFKRGTVEGLGAAEEISGGEAQGSGEGEDGGERRVATPHLDGAHVVGRQASLLGDLLEGEPEGLTSASDIFPERHPRKVDGCGRPDEHPMVLTIQHDHVGVSDGRGLHLARKSRSGGRKRRVEGGAGWRAGSGVSGQRA